MKNQIQWGDVATWLAAIGTLAAFVIAFLQISTERKARLRKEEDDRKQQRRAQAESLSAWVAKEEGGSATWIAVLNNSQEPVHELIASIVPIQGSGDKTGKGVRSEFRGFLSIVPPGRYYVKVSGGYRGMSFQPGVMIAFTDRSGNHWTRGGTGKVEEIAEPAVEYLDLGRPVSWALPDIESIE